MLKKIFFLFLIISMSASFCACGYTSSIEFEEEQLQLSTWQETNYTSGEKTHIHKYEPATCTVAQTCSCGDTVGNALGHDYDTVIYHGADCINGEFKASTCKRCGDYKSTIGEPLGHSWIEATCTERKTCSRCGITEGSPLGGHIGDGDVCERCGQALFKPVSYSGIGDRTITDLNLPKGNYLFTFSTGATNSYNRARVHYDGTNSGRWFQLDTEHSKISTKVFVGEAYNGYIDVNIAEGHSWYLIIESNDTNKE